MKLKAFCCLLAFAAFVSFSLVAWQQHPSLQNNTAPKVTITKPATTDRFEWGSLNHYSISVEDKEDGLSKYDEIAANEVFLKVKFFPDSSSAKTYMAKELTVAEPAALTTIKTSDCFNCHAVRAKLMGPSFESIAKQYANKPSAGTMLSHKIIKGSEKVTGTEKMPAHPQISTGKAKEIVRWIFSNGADATIDYARGLEGTFRTKPEPAKNAGKAVYVLTATYRDHGLPGAPQQAKEGKHVVLLKSN